MVSPETTPTTSGRNSGRHTVSAVKTRKSPLPVIWPRNGGPSPPRGVDAFTAMPIISGTIASTASSAWLRRRPRMSLTSEAYSRPKAPRYLGRSSPIALSAEDIEALPGQRHEQVLEVGPRHRESPQSCAGRDDGGGDGLAGHVAESRRHHQRGRVRGHVLQSERRQRARDDADVGR